MKGGLRHILLLVVAITVVASAPPCSAAQQVLASVDGDEITTLQFADSYVRYLAKSGVDDTSRLRLAFLEEMIARRLLAAEARAAGLDTLAEYRFYRERVEKKLLIEMYVEDEVTSDVDVTEADLEEAFRRLNSEVTARHLFARTKGEAWELYDRLKKGATFEALAAETFVDTSLAANGGSVGTFTFDEMDQDFEDAAFGLEVGEISEPVRTSQGYSVIQVTDRFTTPILSESEFARKKGSLRTLVLRKKRLHARTLFARRLADDLDLAFHSAFDRLLAHITGMALATDETFASFLDEQLLSYNGVDGRVTWTVRQFRGVAAGTDPAQRSQVRTAVDLKEFATGLVVRSHILELARDAEFHRDERLAGAIEATLNAWLTDRYRQRVAAALRVPEDSVRAHYERHPLEFASSDGAVLPFAEARPIIERQLHETYIDRELAGRVAELRRDADLFVDREAVLTLEFGGRGTDRTLLGSL